MGLLPHPLDKSLQQSRLAHPCLAHQQYDVSVSLSRALPGVAQKGQFALASDHWTRSRGVRGRKAALGRTLAKRFPDQDRLAEALDRLLAEKRIIEKIPG